jgi:2-methylisocitrate lyase-like PEP mutase family enzyme
MDPNPGTRPLTQRLQNLGCVIAKAFIDPLPIHRLGARAAAQARRNQDFVIKSRTDAYGTHGLAEAIRRLNLYAEAGADLLFADAVLAEQDIATLVKETIKPVSVNMGFGIRARSTTPLISAKRLED